MLKVQDLSSKRHHNPLLESSGTNDVELNAVPLPTLFGCATQEIEMRTSVSHPEQSNLGNTTILLHGLLTTNGLLATNTSAQGARRSVAPIILSMMDLLPYLHLRFSGHRSVRRPSTPLSRDVWNLPVLPCPLSLSITGRLLRQEPINFLIAIEDCSILILASHCFNWTC